MHVGLSMGAWTDMSFFIHFLFIQRFLKKKKKSVEWWLQQTNPCSIHGAPQPRRVGRPSCARSPQDSAVGKLPNAAVQEMQQPPDSED